MTVAKNNSTDHFVALTEGARFPVREGESVLDAATRASVVIPHSCRSGSCGACKGRIISGRTRVMQSEFALTEAERAQGWVLNCARTVEEDTLIEIEDFSRLKLPDPKIWPSRLHEIKIVSPGVVRVLLRLPPAPKFRFIPGQYVDVIGPSGVRRSYSLASIDPVANLLELHIRAQQGGVMTEYWFNRAKPTDLLRLRGPLGTFCLRDSTGIDLFFLATGTGIAPIKAILQSLADLSIESRPRKVTVLWGGRRLEDFYLNLERDIYINNYIPVHSQPASDWRGYRGYVQDVLLKLSPDFTNAVVYACGSNAMIQNARTRLISAGLAPERFYAEAFSATGMN